ncbi:hypothetical protein [Aeromonas sp. s10]|uniref:hypothetical protein n=1 Tax=Aeromonas sp. s10 TaxID=3138480 RepID=UPI0034A213B5
MLEALKMNLNTYDKLREVAASIRERASTGQNAMEMAHKGAMFLLHEVHESNGIIYGDKASIAKALRQYADTLDADAKKA